MINYVEALIALLPEDAGGRALRIAPRDGSYRPFGRSCETGAQFRLRIIEGPPMLGAGDHGSIVAEVEDGAAVAAGGDIDLLDAQARVVGVLTVLRVWRETVAV